MPQLTGGGNFSEYSGSMKPMSQDTVYEVASQALDQLGMPQSWADALVTLAEKESSFRPGVTAEQGAEYGGGWGTQYAVGLMQMMPPTFSEYAEPGHGDITNPLHNMLASIKYIKANYGNPNKMLQQWDSQGGY